MVEKVGWMPFIFERIGNRIGKALFMVSLLFTIN